MWKRLVVFLVVALFVFGASGGCLNTEPPDLSGTWKGTLSRSINPTVQNFAEITINITQQDSSGNLSGTVDVIYNPGTENQVSFPEMTISSESSTDAFTARIKAVGNTGNNTIQVNYPGGSFTISGEFTFEFEIGHGYACRGGDLNELIGVYALICSGNTRDSGSVTLVKQ